ncbi:E3 ubiquitin-protein ligase RNF115 isoform X2 [Nasonia vitripennis]|uniref:RING-type E3 ubiquitin transferase n=1 Tax=Nasonia vitripennis TaxID=7425 RepID=A0A7M7QF97_NASVI|nr:E3 ubiquitin-protein ligase RNF115 isoform X2 [Nasonia vitripennis]
MAEAIVDGTSSISRFFCHRCSVEIEHLLPDYTCPRCSTGFIEKLERGSAESGSGMDIDNQDLNEIEVDDLPSHFQLPLAFLQEPTALSRYRRNRRNSSSVQSTPRNTRSHRTRSRNQQQQQQSLSPQIDSLLQDLFANLSGIGFGFQPGQGPVLFLGNPGDYVWGQHGLDSIVTQLLNQMDETGPPPLPKKKIEEIPTTTVSQTQIDCKLQCSVCWEDFVLEESVRQLPCQHVYHAPCIVPWLELHGTCPICRQSLGEQSTFDANQDTVGPSLAALFRAANESSSSRTSSASLGSSSRNDSPNEL